MSVTEVKKSTNKETIDILEDMLERAKSGDIQSIAVAAVTNSCQTLNCFSGDYYPMSLIGELRVLEREVIDLCVDTRRKPAWEFCE